MHSRVKRDYQTESASKAKAARKRASKHPEPDTIRANERSDVCARNYAGHLTIDDGRSVSANDASIRAVPRIGDEIGKPRAKGKLRGID